MSTNSGAVHVRGFVCGVFYESCVSGNQRFAGKANTAPTNSKLRGATCRRNTWFSAKL